MDNNSSLQPPKGESSITGAVLKRMLQVVMQFLFLATMLFISSGHVNWMWAWAYLGVGLGILMINLLILPPELVAERGQPRGGVKRWDKVLATLGGLAALGVPIVAGLDERFGWSPPLPPAIHLLGLAFLALGQGLFSWAMVSNKYFSTVVRIQMDRGHTVATGGPYQYVRHPGYVGYVVTCFATSVALGSLWGIILGGLVACIYVVRTALEDQTLENELPGYKDYAQRVRYRLLPGIW